MNDREFDALLESAAPELPPDDVARDVTPWRRAIGNILGGSALCSITLNFFCLNYLLPTIGVILQLLGFRPLRRENRWFRACWLLAVLRAALFLPCIVLNATIYSQTVYASSVGTALTYAMLAVQMLLFFCFWQALRTMQKKAGTGEGAAPAAALLIWYAAVLVLAYFQYVSLLFALAMLGCYLFILYSLCRLTWEMEESGYALTPAPVRLSDGALTGIIAALLTVGIACGYLFFGSYRMDWQPESGSLSAEATEIRAQLLVLGYPEAALNDLSEDDLLACRGAQDLIRQEYDVPGNLGHEERTIIGSTTHIQTVYDQKELHLTDVAVQLPGEPERWAVFHHFRWPDDTVFYGTECLLVRPAYNSPYWQVSGYVLREPTGRLLYDADGVTCAAPYWSLTQEAYGQASFFGDTQHFSDIFAAFSLPARGEGRRGYLTYSIEVADGDWTADSWVFYAHQYSPLQYPVQTAGDLLRISAAGSRGAFVIERNNLMFTRNKDGSLYQYGINRTG